MHDIVKNAIPTMSHCNTNLSFCKVRDFTLSVHSAEELRELQRSFVRALLAEYSEVAEQSSKAANTVKAYTTSELSHHLKGALTLPLYDDDLARAVCLHQNDDIVDQVCDRHTGRIEVCNSL